MDTTRKIIHVDMDAFFASVEQRDNPSLKGKPVIVGGSPDKRGVVATCSYEARKYGIHSAMASSIAKRLCPHAIFVRGRFDAYKTASKKIMEIFHTFTDKVEPLSIDEAFLDVTENKLNIRYATEIAKLIQKKILDELALTASCGVSFNKFLAKIASDIKKPFGITVITPKYALEFLEKLPIGKFYGIGKVTEKKMKTFGIHNGKDLKKMELNELIHYFGKMGEFYYNIVRGNDPRLVEILAAKRGSIGSETTFEKDVYDKRKISITLKSIVDSIVKSLKKKDIFAFTVSIKIRYHNFETITKSYTASDAFNSASYMKKIVLFLLDKTEAGNVKIRLVGVTVSKLIKSNEKKYVQQHLPLKYFDE